MTYILNAKYQFYSIRFAEIKLSLLSLFGDGRILNGKNRYSLERKTLARTSCDDQTKKNCRWRNEPFNLCNRIRQLLCSVNRLFSVLSMSLE